ncbi:MAG: glycerophosphodiester phosphodiesterase [Candidatus Parcubacteria bacterium]|nr:MAG: glycerophosphodiester phosphodiesterase [Candidatus Parcubacteria bacterium]
MPRGFESENRVSFLPFGACGYILGRMLILGHRGVCGKGVAENSLAAVAAALEAGADGVEIDVRVAKDGVVLLAHDRVCVFGANGERKEVVPASQSASLRELGLASLDELFSFLREQRTVRGEVPFLNVELKDVGSAKVVAARVRQALAEGWPEERLLISSFGPHALKALERALPPATLGIIADACVEDLPRVARRNGWGNVVLNAEWATPEVVAQGRKEGLGVWVWAPDDPELLREMFALPLSGVIVDDPALARRVWQE